MDGMIKSCHDAVESFGPLSLSSVIRLRFCPPGHHPLCRHSIGHRSSAVSSVASSSGLTRGSMPFVVGRRMALRWGEVTAWVA